MPPWGLVGRIENRLLEETGQGEEAVAWLCLASPHRSGMWRVGRAWLVECAHFGNCDGRDGGTTKQGDALQARQAAVPPRLARAHVVGGPAIRRNTPAPPHHGGRLLPRAQGRQSGELTQPRARLKARGPGPRANTPVWRRDHAHSHRHAGRRRTAPRSGSGRVGRRGGGRRAIRLSQAHVLRCRRRHSAIARRHTPQRGSRAARGQRR